MKQACTVLAIAACVLMMSTAAFATNGDNLMAIGPIARAMGGVGVAAPQDAISAVFANPAAMCFAPYCPSSEANFAGTVFMPHIDAKVSMPGQTFQAESHQKVYPIPAIGVSLPITTQYPFWRFGLAAYGVSGLGVDYRDTALDQRQFFNLGPFGTQPLISGEFSELSIMKFAPSIAFQPMEKLSLGLAMHIDYANLDLRQGSSSNFGVGAQIGAIYKINDNLQVGLNYVSPQNVDHDRVADFNGDGRLDTLSLQSPQQVALGAAYTLLDRRLLLEADFKWINWSSANGYQTFGWDDQFVAAIGAQYRPMPKLALRAGYNYGTNPVSTHNGFNGTLPASVQGKVLPAYYFETFRIIGFPAVVTQHATAGIGYDFTPRIGMNIGYTHGFANTIRERGTNLIGQPVTLESTLSEDSVELGLTWRF